MSKRALMMSRLFIFQKCRYLMERLNNFQPILNFYITSTRNLLSLPKKKIPPCFQERDPPLKFIMPRVVTPQIF